MISSQISRVSKLHVVSVCKRPWTLYIPSETDTTAIALRIVQDAARDYGIVVENRCELALIHVLWQVGDVKVSRALVTLGLEARVEGLLHLG